MLRALAALALILAAPLASADPPPASPEGSIPTPEPPPLDLPPLPPPFGPDVVNRVICVVTESTRVGPLQLPTPAVYEGSSCDGGGEGQT